jgi:hypothetical protein
MKQLRKHLTYANVVGTLALFLVLTGATAFAATQLGKNSVGTKQLKKNAVTAAKIKKGAVTGAKVKKDSITGTQVNEATLGTVPSAALASSLTPMEPTHIVGAPGEPPFEGGSHNVGSSGPLGLNSVGFYKDHEGIVHLQGIAETGKATVGGVASVFTLPPGFRPAPGKVLVLEMVNEGGAIIAGSNVFFEGDLSGKILGGEENLVVLDGITYRAES